MSDWIELRCNLCGQPGHETNSCPVEEWLVSRFSDLARFTNTCQQFKVDTDGLVDQDKQAAWVVRFALLSFNRNNPKRWANLEEVQP